MKIENIQVGSVARNYKHMCSLIGEIECTGKSKQLQLKRWKCYFEFERQGNKMVVTEIFEANKPLPKRGGNNISPHLNQVKELIIQLLLHSGNKKLILSKYRLLEALSMINMNYRQGKKQIDRLSNETKIKKIDIYDFYNAADDMLKRNIEKSLSELEDRRAIFWSKIFMVSKNNKIDVASDDQVELIMNVQLEILKKMGYESLKEIFSSGNIEEFNRKTNKRLYELAEIKYIYEAYSVILNRERLEELEKLSRKTIREIEITLNQSVIHRLNQNSTKRHNKSIGQNDEFFGFFSENKKSYRMSENYSTNQSKLSEILIDIQHPVIFNE
ncbi:hypothetical protein [Paenibacillus sp. USHLN196]|uniref:hypothetical protein n=1 Tax=Paenibacillus sp. USHLN196 TaxID=3081291 RepID=UPI003015CDD8